MAEPTAVHLVVPGPLDQRTGGYIYDRRIVAGLREQGWRVQVHELPGRFPEPDETARTAAGEAAGAMKDGLAVIDGLALLAFESVIDKLPQPWIGLIHHPLSMETGLEPAAAERVAALETRLMAAAGRLIVTSPMTVRDLERMGLDPESITAVLPGVDPASPAAGSAPGAPRALLAVGSLTRRKGHDVLLKALAEIADLDWTLALVGSAAWDPPHAAELGDLVAALGLEDRVRLIGEQDEAGLARFYHEADLFVLASHHEGYGMVLAEALARGLPIVSTTAGAIPRTVPEDAGLLVPPGEPGTLAAALCTVLTEGERYRALAAGAARAREHLGDWGTAAAAFAAVLRQTAA
jgi:glycosyltransferase involved in cell wall biosynthesis